MTVEQQHPWFLNKFIGFLSFSQKFVLISCLFGFSILVTSYLMIHDQNASINFVKNELKGLYYAVPIRKLSKDITLHYLLTDRYFAGETSLKNDVLKLESQIHSEFEALLASNLHEWDNIENNVPNQISLQKIFASWESIAKNANELNSSENQRINLEIIDNLKSLIDYIGDQSYLNFDPNYKSSYLISIALLSSEDVLTSTAKLTAQTYKMITHNRDTLKDKYELIALSSVLEGFLASIKLGGEKASDAMSRGELRLSGQTDIRTIFNKLVTQIYEFTSYIDKSVIYSSELPKDTKELINLSLKSLEDIDAFWLASKDELQNILQDRLNSLKFQQLLSVGIAFFSAFCGCVLGFWIMRQISTPLNNLVQAARRLADGDLSARVLFVSNDEVGEVGVAFNQMADSFQDLIGQLQWTGIQLTTSTTEIAATAKQQEATIVQQEATTKQIATTAHEISNSSKAFAKTMSQVSTMAEKTSSLATSGKAGLTMMEKIMRQMVDAAGNIASKLAVLNEKAGSITTIITTISKVADQTNLLSLNAAIEAEKAGEYGRSFAVIAREIRRLADQTANALLDIEKMVNEMVSAVSAGVMGVDKFSEEINTGVNQVSNVSEQLSEIIEQVQQQTTGFETVNQGMQHQSLGAEQITDSINQLSEAAQQTTESIRQFHNAIEQLNNAAQDMQTAVSKIKR